MLSDRSYMRHESGRPRPGFLAIFLGAIVTGYVLQRVGEVFFGFGGILEYGALSAEGVRSGHVWTPLTYVFLHGGVTHLLLNGLGLFFLGRALIEALGESRLAGLSVAGTLGAAAAWLAIHFGRSGMVIGASGVVMAYLAVFACLNPRRPMTLLLFFILPVTVQPIWLVAVIGGVDLLGFLTQELPGRGSLYGVAHSAHLGGLAAGWLFYRFAVLRPAFWRPISIEPPGWLRKRGARPALASAVNLQSSAASGSGAAHAGLAAMAAHPHSREALKAEVDRILDKINLHGFASLTEAEKRVLDEARQQLSHR